MTYRGIRARWIALVGGVVAVMAVTTAVLAQPQPQFRFYGLPGDSTIDGEIAPVGSTVTASANGAVLDSAEIGEAGTWYIDVEPETENIVFTLNGLSDDHTYEAQTVGGSRKVELHVNTPAPEDATDTEAEVMLEGDDASESGDASLMSAEGDGEDSMELSEAEDESMAGESDEAMQEESDEEDYPVSGTGGLFEEQGASWPLAVGVTAALMALVAGAALVISRRTDRVS